MSELSSNALTAENPQRDIRLAAMNLLARREHAFHELLTKLTQKFSKSDHHPRPMIEGELCRLKEEGLQSDERFVEAFINSKKNSGKGPLVIRQQLRQKGISDEMMALQLEAIDDEWFELAKELYRRKYHDKQIADHKEKAKRMRFMQSRGFLSEHYAHLLDINANE